MMKKQLTEARFQFLAGIISENEFKQLNEMIDIQDKLESAGFIFDDGILGGVGSGGGGYYDYDSDQISGFKLDKFDEDEFNKWYDNFDINSFNSNDWSDVEEMEDDWGIDVEAIKNIKPGMYRVGESGFADIKSDGTLTLYATPSIMDLKGDEDYEEIFVLDNNRNVKPAISKDKLKSYLIQNIENPGSWGII